MTCSSSCSFQTSATSIEIFFRRATLARYKFTDLRCSIWLGLVVVVSTKSERRQWQWASFSSLTPHLSLERFRDCRCTRGPTAQLVGAKTPQMSQIEGGVREEVGHCGRRKRRIVWATSTWPYTCTISAHGPSVRTRRSTFSLITTRGTRD
jgi:hypothetical protein